MKLSPAKSKSRTLYLTVFSGLNTLPALASLSFDALASPLSSPTPPPPAFLSPLALPCHFAGRRHTAERFKYHTLKEVMKNQGKSHQILCSGPKLVQQAPAKAGARALGLVHPDLLVLQVLLSEDLSVTRFSACSPPGMPAGAPGPAQGNRKGENLTRVEGVRPHLWGGGNADRVLALLPLDQNLMRLRISVGVLVPWRQSGPKVSLSPGHMAQ